ncbi:hypothetical protein [Sphingorhabdus sp. Alg239-R122]|uniref:hypothetical protein n=1 Tax=Sphingorhabdus sp. Alg239-R122 TaxID=2305989 RepID=UPI0013DD02E9|nr:hypothetical protein [Sphingorhabdus sp. Alg239-R122]
MTTTKTILTAIVAASLMTGTAYADDGGRSQVVTTETQKSGGVAALFDPLLDVLRDILGIDDGKSVGDGGDDLLVVNNGDGSDFDW